jgi:hypothetical protein
VPICEPSRAITGPTQIAASGTCRTDRYDIAIRGTQLATQYHTRRSVLRLKRWARNAAVASVVVISVSITADHGSFEKLGGAHSEM